MSKKGVLRTVAFLLFTAVFCVGSIIVPDRDFSENENRNLQKFPSVRVDAIASGKFQSQLNDYTADQIIGRDFLTGVKTVTEKLLGKRDIGGVYLGYDGYYIEKITEDDIDETVFKNNLNAVEMLFRNQGKKLGGKAHFMLVPTAGAVLNVLPAAAEIFNQKERIKAAKERLGDNFIDVTSALKKADKDDKQIYYKTDHHWTTRGAYTAYCEYAKCMGFKAAEYSAKPVTDSFRGSLFSKVVDPFSEYDTVEAPKIPENITVTADGKQLGGFYDKSKLQQKDKYAYFLGGNYARTDIKGNGKGKLLLIKDSYANCFLPFLLDRYETVTLLDPRYLTSSVSEIVEKGNYTEILLLFNAENFCQDKTISIIAG